jgi:hypothetical protein
MRVSIRRVVLLTAICACGETLPSATDNDAGGPGADGGSDASAVGDANATDGGDAGARADLVTDRIVEPWRIAVAGDDLVVTSYAESAGGVFRVGKSGGDVVKIGLRRAYGIAVKNGDDIWFCNADTAPGLVEVALDG